MLPRTFLFMLACAGIGYLLGRSRGMGLPGFLLGFAFGPLGWGIILLWPRGRSRAWSRMPGQGQSSGGGPDSRQGRADPGPDRDGRDRQFPQACPRCGHATGGGAGACRHCGNVLVPIRYQVSRGRGGDPA